MHACVSPLEGRGRERGAQPGERPSAEKAAIVKAGQLHQGPRGRFAGRIRALSSLCVCRRAKKKGGGAETVGWGGGEERDRREKREHRKLVEGGGGGELLALDGICRLIHDGPATIPQAPMTGQALFHPGTGMRERTAQVVPAPSELTFQKGGYQ